MDSSPAFCTGCDFSGRIPAGSKISAGCRLSTANGVSETYLMDDEFRISNGIVDLKNIETAPDIDFAAQKVRDCNGEYCLLGDSGVLPVDATDEAHRAAVEAYLNNRAGIQALGGISFSNV